MRAAARVNVEQASKCRCRSRPATRDGEVAGNHEASDECSGFSCRGNDGSTHGGIESWATGETCRGAHLIRVGNDGSARTRHRPEQVADGSVRAMMLGNAGGAKGPW